MDLIISDLHLTDAPLEEYRWGIFDWLYDLKEEYDFDNIFLLGDITEKKDNHSAKLVNRVVEELQALAFEVSSLHILRGNHDGIDPNWPFFGFLNSADNIYYHSNPIAMDNWLFLPYSKDPANEWNDILKKHIKETDIIFMHQTTFGGKASNGMALEGFDSGIFADFDGLIFSGDLHLPQETGGIIYVGSPYPVYFGDDFTGGAILLHHDGKVGPGLGPYERINYQTIKRTMLDIDFTGDQVIPVTLTVNKGDQFKIRLKVNRSDSGEFDDWKKLLKTYIERSGGIVVSMELKLAEEKSRLLRKRKFINTEPITVFNRYCKAEGLDEYYSEKGKEFLE